MFGLIKRLFGIEREVKQYGRRPANTAPTFTTTTMVQWAVILLMPMCASVTIQGCSKSLTTQTEPEVDPSEG